MKTPPALLVCLASAPTAAFAGPHQLEVEVGIVVDVFSESYGAGDLFFDQSDLPGQDDVLDEEDVVRIENDETLVGARLGLTWAEGDGFHRRVDLAYEQNEASATGDVDARWRFGDGEEGWRLDVSEQLRLQAGLAPGDESRDLLQRLDVDLSRVVGSLGRLTLRGEQSFSRVSGDSLSRLFDYTYHGLGVELDRALGGLDARWRLDAAYRDAASDFSSNDVRLAARTELHRYAFESTSFDVALEAIRRLYDDSGIVSSSRVEGLADARASHPVGAGVELLAEARVTEVRFDEPDATYVDYGVGNGALGAAWSVSSGVTLEAALGGEWLRPRGGGTGAYDQSRVRVGGSTLGPGSLWIDVEASFGRRSYLGASASGGLLTDQGSLDLTSTDFTYSELTVLFGWALGDVGVDAYAQHTVEMHDDEADDVSFVVVNVRVTSRF